MYNFYTLVPIQKQIICSRHTESNVQPLSEYNSFSLLCTVNHCSVEVLCTPTPTDMISYTLRWELHPLKSAESCVLMPSIPAILLILHELHVTRGLTRLLFHALLGSQWDHASGNYTAYVIKHFFKLLYIFPRISCPSSTAFYPSSLLLLKFFFMYVTFLASLLEFILNLGRNQPLHHHLGHWQF